MANTNIPAFNPSVSVCFTGHRPKDMGLMRPYDPSSRPFYQKIVDELHALVLELHAKGYMHFITGGAQGFDQLAFWAVNSAKSTAPNIVNEVYVPFTGQERRWSATGIFSQTEYQQMLAAADRIHICSPTPDTNSFCAKELLYRNQCMVNDSMIVIGQYTDDSWRTASHGGTAHCLKYADSVGRQLIIRPFGCS